MTPSDALQELLARLGASEGAAVLVSEEESNEWPKSAVQAMKKAELLAPASPASSAVCSGCEQQCFMPVHTLPAKTRKPAFAIFCDKRDDISRVDVPLERLRQSSCSTQAVGAFVAQSLGLSQKGQRGAGAGIRELGLISGKKRRQMICLRANDALELVVGQNTIPLAELVLFGAEGYFVDRESIRQLVDAATTGDPRYTPSNTRREARKLDTQALHEKWRKEYRALKKRRPGMSATWYSQQIAKMDVADGRNAETIRKHMKG